MIERQPVVGASVKLEIWSDVVCPWCYIGKRRMETALRQFEHGDEVDVTWRSFELDPGAPAVRKGPYVDRLASKYRLPVAEAQAMIDRMTEAAAGEGLRFRFDIARPGNTFDAHRLLHLAAVHGLQDELEERLMAAAFTEGQAIGEHGALVRLATDVGVDGDEVANVLTSDLYAEAVLDDERVAAELGITTVPFFVVDRAYGASGAQPPEVLCALLQRAWADRRAPEPSAAPGCHGAGCDVGPT